MLLFLFFYCQKEVILENQYRRILRDIGKEITKEKDPMVFLYLSELYKVQKEEFKTIVSIYSG